MKNKITNSLEFSSDWDNWIGEEVVKFSNKPFKSGQKVGTPIGVETNPHSGKKAFKMTDDSVVDCLRTHLYFKE